MGESAGRCKLLSLFPVMDICVYAYLPRQASCEQSEEQRRKMIH